MEKENRWINKQVFNTLISGNIDGNAAPASRKINGKSLTQDVQITATDVHAVTPEILRAEIPIGVPLPWPTKRAPTGWFICNGEPFDKKKHPLLAQAYPSGKLPDLRGEFISGWDAGKGIDYQRVILSRQDATRLPSIYVYANSATHGTLVTPPISEYGTKYPTEKSVDNAETIKEGSGAYYSTSLSTNGHVSLSTFCVRPRNVAFNYIVRAA